MSIFCIVLQVGQCFVLLDSKVRLPVLETDAVRANLEIARQAAAPTPHAVDETD